MSVQKMRRPRPNSDRRGLAIIMVIAFYAIAMAMIGVWVRSALDRQQQAKQWHHKAQAIWMADAGVRRAVVQLAKQDAYEGEVWEIGSAELGGSSSAKVVIKIETRRDSADVEIVAIATYPVDGKQRAQHTRALNYSIPVPSEASGESS